jgi:hypothetical protein
VTISSIDGFRKNLEATLPEIAKELNAKIMRLDAQLSDLRADLKYVEHIAVSAGVDLQRKKTNGGSEEPVGDKKPASVA